MTDKTPAQISDELQEARARIAEMEETLRAIRAGEVDGIMVLTSEGEKLFTLSSVDLPYRIMVEEMNEGAVTLASDGTILFCNRRFADMVRTPLEKVTGSSIYRYVFSGDFLSLNALIEQGSKKNHKMESSLQTGGGSFIPVQLSISAFGHSVMPGALCLIVTDLTEQKRNEEIFAQEKLTGQILKQTDEILIICDNSGRIIRASQSAQRLLNYSPVLKSFDEIFKLQYPDGAPFVLCAKRNSKKNKQVCREEVVFKSSDGKLQFFLLNSSPFVTKKYFSGTVVIMVDITERKKAEADLEHVRNILIEGQRIAHLGTFEYIADTRTTVWSEEEYRIYGLDPAQPSPDYDVMLAENIYPADAELLHKAFTEAVRNRSIYELEHRIVRPDGNVRWVYDCAYPHLDKDGKLFRYVGATLDITERRNAEEALQKAHRELERRVEERTAQLTQTAALAKAERQRLYDVLETLPAYICLLTPDYQMPFANRKFREWFNYNPEKKCHDFLFDLSRPCERCETYKVIKTKASHHWEWTGPNGRDYDVFDFPFIDTDGSPLILEMGTDITDRKQAEKEIRELNKMLEQRLAMLEQANLELEEFAHVTSHDLQEPLRKIQTFCDIIKTRSAFSQDSDGPRYLDRVVSLARRMREVLDDLLQVSRLSENSEEFKAVDLGKIAHEAADLFENELKNSGGAVEIDYMPVIEAEDTQMLRLFQNIIGNAVKFHSEKIPHIKIFSRQEDEACRIFIKDNGIGFEQEFAERIFKPFQRLHGRNEYGGTGMGLAICRKIAERHGGNIGAESEPGKGSTFIIRLPLKRKE